MAYINKQGDIPKKKLLLFGVLFLLPVLALIIGIVLRISIGRNSLFTVLIILGGIGGFHVLLFFFATQMIVKKNIDLPNQQPEQFRATIEQSPQPNVNSECLPQPRLTLEEEYIRPPKRNSGIYISYSQKDQKVAEAIAAALEKIPGAFPSVLAEPQRKKAVNPQGFYAFLMLRSASAVRDDIFSTEWLAAEEAGIPIYSVYLMPGGRIRFPFDLKFRNDRVQPAEDCIAPLVHEILNLDKDDFQVETKFASAFDLPEFEVQPTDTPENEIAPKKPLPSDSRLIVLYDCQGGAGSCAWIDALVCSSADYDAVISLIESCEMSATLRNGSYFSAGVIRLNGPGLIQEAEQNPIWRNALGITHWAIHIPVECESDIFRFSVIPKLDCFGDSLHEYFFDMRIGSAERLCPDPLPTDINPISVISAK